MYTYPYVARRPMFYFTLLHASNVYNLDPDLFSAVICLHDPPAMEMAVSSTLSNSSDLHGGRTAGQGCAFPCAQYAPSSRAASLSIVAAVVVSITPMASFDPPRFVLRAAVWLRISHLGVHLVRGASGPQVDGGSGTAVVFCCCLIQSPG